MTSIRLHRFWKFLRLLGKQPARHNLFNPPGFLRVRREIGVKVVRDRHDTTLARLGFGALDCDVTLFQVDVFPIEPMDFRATAAGKCTDGRKRNPFVGQAVQNCLHFLRLINRDIDIAVGGLPQMVSLGSMFRGR